MRLKSKYHKLTYMKGKASDRKGMGMELALMVLLVVFLCSALLVTSALIGKSNLQAKEQQLRNRMILDQIAEYHLGINGAEISSDSYLVDESVDGVLVITDLSGNPLLTVEMDGDQKITKWEYH